MSERRLEVVRQPDGRFLASFDDGQPAVEVSSWDDIRRLRARRHLVDHWVEVLTGRRSSRGTATRLTIGGPS